VWAKAIYTGWERQRGAQLDQQGQVQFAEQPLPSTPESRLQQSVLEEIYDLSKNDPSIAASISDLLSPTLGARTDADVGTILQNNPDFANTPVIQYLQQNGLSNQQLTLDLANLKGTFAQSLADLQSGVFDQALPLLQNINQTELTTYTTLEQYITQATDRANQEALAQQQQQDHELKIAASQQGVYLLSTFAGFFDPKLGHDMGVVGNAALQVADAVSKYTFPAAAVDTSSIFGNLTGGSLGGVILTGYIVSAAMQIASVFQDNPSPDQIILDQLKQISAQITALQNNMNQRFDRIDRKLDQIAGNIVTILGTLNQVGTRITQVQTQLYELQTQVGRLESEIHTWLTESDRLPLQIAINNAIGYQTRTGQPLAKPDYDNYESQFYTWAYSFSSSNTLAGDDYSPGSRPFAELTQVQSGQPSGVPFADKINYLAQFVSQGLGFQFSVPPRLPSPPDWAFSSNAYAQLIRENADIASREPGAIGRVQDVISVGRQLQGVLNALASQPLFLDPSQGLLAFYRQKRDALKQNMNTFESSFIKQNTCPPGNFSSNCIPSNVDLWADPSTPTSYVPPFSGVAPCPGGQLAPWTRSSYPLGGNNLFYDTPTALLLADQRYGNQLSLCIYPTWSGTSDPGLNNTAPLQINIQVLYQGVVVETLSMVTYWTTSCFEGDPGEPPCAYPWTWWYWVPPYWTDAPCVGCPTLQQMFLDHSNISISRSSWVQSLYQTLQSERVNFYSQVDAAFTQGGGIQTASDDLSGAKLLLDAYVALGLPRTLEGNDYVRYLLYGGQQNAQTVFLGGPDPNNPNNGSTVQNLYVTASPQPPELDITAVTDQRINALASVLTARFNQISQGQFQESQRLVTGTLQNLGDLLPGGLLSSSNLNFPSQVVGGISSAPLTVTLTNPGSLSFIINSISLSPGFQETNDCGNALMGGGSCTLSIIFTPSDASGSTNGTMTITDAQGNTHTVSLSGTGTDFSLSASSLSASVPAGKSATYPFNLAPINGFNQPVSFNCTWPKGQPQGTNCSISPTSIAPNGSASANATLSVTTTGNSIVSPSGLNLEMQFWGLIAIAGLLLTMALRIGGASERIRRWRYVMVFAAMLLLGSTIGCPGPHQGSGNGNTPPGNYTIQVSASAGGATRTINFQLAVN